MNPELAFTLLATRPQAIRRVAQWWCDEWGLPSRHSSFDECVHELQALVPGVLPIHILGEQAGSVVGVATLKMKIDHPVIPGQSHWLSGVYVDPPCRNRGIASSLCSESSTLRGAVASNGCIYRRSALMADSVRNLGGRLLDGMTKKTVLSRLSWSKICPWFRQAQRPPSHVVLGSGRGHGFCRLRVHTKVEQGA
jgi:hypothetical protein